MTQLCAIPGCRIRGRHLPSCAEDSCAGCLPRATDEGLACDACVDRAAARLTAIAELTPDARLVAAGLVRRGSGGGGSGKPGSRPPLNDGATDAVNAVENALTTIARDIAETRGLQINSAGREDRGVGDPLVEAAKWISSQMEWVRHAVEDQGGPYAAAVFAEIADCASRLRGMLDGPAPRDIVGKCPCGRTLYARRDQQTVTCADCGQQWDAADSRATLRTHLDDHLVTAAEAAHLAAYLDTDRSVRQIRRMVGMWADRGRLPRHDVLVKHQHRDSCAETCTEIRDTVAVYRFGEIAALMAAAQPRTARDRAEMGA